MAQRPIKSEERALIEHLLGFLKPGHGYKVPDEVVSLGEGGMGGIQLSSKGQHTYDLVEAEYKDADGREVLITLTANQHGELFDLDIWKVDFSSLQRYPVPEAVRPAR